MAISDKLQEVYDNVDLVYSAGVSIGRMEGMASNAIYYATKLEGTFSNTAFPLNYALELRTKKSPTTILNMFYKATGVKSVKLISEENTGTVNMQSAFREVASINTIDLREFNRKPSSVAYLFLSAGALVNVLGAFDFSELTAADLWLLGATNLVHMEFVKETIKISISFEWCRILSKASLTSIVNGLSSDVTGKGVKFAQAAIDAAFTPAEWAGLIEKKPNWNFVYI